MKRIKFTRRIEEILLDAEAIYEDPNKRRNFATKHIARLVQNNYRRRRNYKIYRHVSIKHGELK